MRTIAITAVLTAAALTTPVIAQDHDADVAVAGGNFVEGWKGRLDRGTDFSSVNFRMEEGALRVTVGPAIVLYRDADMVQGNFKASASFTQMSSLGHAHSYGLIVGGADLQGAGQRYTYYLVQGDGTYLIKQRNGTELTLISQGDSRGYVKSPHVRMPNENGVGNNVLGIEVRGEDVIFLMNGQEVTRAPASQVQPNGLVGLRINHNLDVKVADFAITR